MSQRKITAFVFIVSLIAMSGSLYYSEVKGYLPCDLCWYQRICMYPMVVCAYVAWQTKIHIHRFFLLPLIGIAVSIYHNIIVFKALGAAYCTQNCAQGYTNYLGFISIPFMALCAFTLILVAMAYSFYQERKNKKTT